MKPPSLSSYLFATTLQIAMDDAMDTTLDAQPIFTSSSDENFYLSPSVSDDYPELDWQESQRTALIKKMNMMSRALRWPHRLASIESVDDEVWLFADILVHLTEKLSKTDLHSKFIPPKQHEAAKEFFEMFNDTDFNRWLAGVQKAVHNDDWDDLIAHRTYIFASGDLVLSQNSDTSATIFKNYFHTRIEVRSPQNA
jgi:hypothetical protein